MNSLGINKSKKETKVVVAMSGGVDSSVVAALMKQEGYDVTGITLKLYDDTKQSKEGRQCCAGQDIMDAKRVSEKININHEILYYQKKFKTEVIDSFIDSYASGETPIPCVQCNQTVKFRDLFKYAKDFKSKDALITGHYVSRIKKNGHASMYRAKDYNRDQSYFLFSTTQEQLDFLRFPLGEIEKSETRTIAKKLNLNVADKPDSQDICFVPNGDYSSVIKKFRPESFKKGKIIDLNSTSINYKFKTFGILSAIFLAIHSIFLGIKFDIQIYKLMRRVVLLLFIIFEIINIKVRSTGRLLKAKIKILDNFADVEILDKETGISPGQACVFYSKDDIGDKVLGGGWIHKTINNNLSTKLTV